MIWQKKFKDSIVEENFCSFCKKYINNPNKHGTQQDITTKKRIMLADLDLVLAQAQKEADKVSVSVQFEKNVCKPTRIYLKHLIRRFPETGDRVNLILSRMKEEQGKIVEKNAFSELWKALKEAEK